MHPDRLLSLQDLDSVTHHTRLMQCWLTVEDDNVAVVEMSVDLAVDLGRAGVRESDVGSIEARGLARLGGKELVSLSSALLL